MYRTYAHQTLSSIAPNAALTIARRTADAGGRVGDDTVTARTSRSVSAVVVAALVVLATDGFAGVAAAQTASVTQSTTATTALPGDEVTLTTTFETSADTGAPQLQLEFPEGWEGELDDTDGDGQLSDESAVVTEDVTLDGGESTTVEFTGIDTSGLVPGDYAHGVLSEDDTETTTLTIEQANRPPTADAGDDRTVAEVTAVELNATGSADPDGDPLTYRWTEATNTGVTLTDADTATPTFTSPAVDSATTLTFEVTVTDESGATDTDTVNVTVQPTTVTEAVASYGSGDDATIEDDEIQQAVFWWQTGAEVPGTGGETITDGEIQQLVFQWQTGATVTGS
ncbi:PKD domain-containing protein [Haloarcula marina]|uniref:PKD domain-containing protein n=1 Tax=Haloarcula marina TaxID=2961574 RepID=UPI0020B7F3FD|nr:PKD domain-containing protein [Halomicroarcula marina]